MRIEQTLTGEPSPGLLAYIFNRDTNFGVTVNTHEQIGAFYLSGTTAPELGYYLINPDVGRLLREGALGCVFETSSLNPIAIEKDRIPEYIDEDDVYYDINIPFKPKREFEIEVEIESIERPKPKIIVDDDLLALED